jgi:hypothetical protein
MEKDTVEVVLNPVARFVPGANGAVDLYVAPAYDDIASLYLEDDHWVLHYPDRPDPRATGTVIEIKPQPYSETTIRKILDGMATDGLTSSVHRPGQGKMTRERNPFDPGPYCYVSDGRLTVFRDVIQKNCCGIYKMVLLCPMCKLRHSQAEKAESKRFFPAISDRVRRINRWLDQLLT